MNTAPPPPGNGNAAPRGAGRASPPPGRGPARAAERARASPPLPYLESNTAGLALPLITRLAEATGSVTRDARPSSRAGAGEERLTTTASVRLREWPVRPARVPYIG